MFVLFYVYLSSLNFCLSGKSGKTLLNLHVTYYPIPVHINSFNSSKQLNWAEFLGHPFHKWIRSPGLNWVYLDPKSKLITTPPFLSSSLVGGSIVTLWHRPDETRLFSLPTGRRHKMHRGSYEADASPGWKAINSIYCHARKVYPKYKDYLSSWDINVRPTHGE